MSKLFIESKCTTGVIEKKTIISDKVSRINKVKVAMIDMTIDINILKSLDEEVAKDMLYKHIKDHVGI
mgnify:CR=1 FL=1